jgi:hypothetical protein
MPSPGSVAFRERGERATLARERRVASGQRDGEGEILAGFRLERITMPDTAFGRFCVSGKGRNLRETVRCDWETPAEQGL